MGELQQKQVGLEDAVGASEDLDVSAAMGVFHRTKDQVDLNAQLVSAAKEMENILYTDFLIISSKLDTGESFKIAKLKIYLLLRIWSATILKNYKSLK